MRSRAIVSALSPFALALTLSAQGQVSREASAQAPVPDLPVSLDRIRAEIEKPVSEFKLNRPLDMPVAAFRTRVEQRSYMLSFEDWLKQELELTELQRQSAEWASMCCSGYVLASGAVPVNLDWIFDKIDAALERRKIRKINEQIDRELAALQEARKRAAGSDK